MKILGIDPGYGIVGYGIIESDGYNLKVIDYGVITTPKEDTLPVRLNIIADCLTQIINSYKPDQIAIEELFYFKNQKTIIPVAEARGVIVHICGKLCENNVFEYTPLQVKQALTGIGRAEKYQIQYMVKTLLGLEKIPKPDDAADALAIAITHSQINSALNTNKI